MALLIKKRALAEYSQSVTDSIPFPKKLNNSKKLYNYECVISNVNLLELTKTSNESLQCLFRISEAVDRDNQELCDIVLKALKKFYTPDKEAAVKTLILTLIAETAMTSSVDILKTIECIIGFLKNESSHRVKTQGIVTCLRLGKMQFTRVEVVKRLIELAEENLKDTGHSVKNRCLETLSVIYPIDFPKEDVTRTINLIYSYTHSEDARVRGQAFSSLILMHTRGFRLSVDFYPHVCSALKDDYEIVRKEALTLVWIFGNKYPDRMLNLENSVEKIRMVDDAFGKVCSCTTDLSIHVRAQSCRLLGLMQKVSSKFLHQTLDKKLMSNMRRKKTAHERQWENVTSGEWSSGKKWADDAPKELLEAESISLISNGACGAMVHGLEDEFLQVRIEAVESLCRLSLDNAQFANIAIDFLVDMFNDEIEEVRVKAIDSLTRISRHILLREDQLEIVLGALEDSSLDVREGLHRMLAACSLATSSCLQMVVTKLLDNLRKYPCDRRSTWRLLQKCGAKHPSLALQLVPQLLNFHPFFDTTEPDVEDPSYISILILILNAAKFCPTMISLFEECTLRHYDYLRDTMPQLVPWLNIQCKNEEKNAHTMARSGGEKPSASLSTYQFLETITKNVELNAPKSVKHDLLKSAQIHLLKIADMEGVITGAANFIALHIGAQLLIGKIVGDRSLNDSRGTISIGSISALQENKSRINDLLLHCAKLKYVFNNLNREEISSVWQLRVYALAVQLICVVSGSNVSALTLCQHFINAVAELDCGLKLLNVKNLHPLIATISAQLNAFDETPKSGTVVRMLLPILKKFEAEKPMKPRCEIQMCRATILQPTGETDTALKFTAGLIVSVPFEAEILHLKHKELLRIKVKYPDQHVQFTAPKPIDMRPLGLENEDNFDNFNNYRLLTQVLLSHQVWSEACSVQISLVLAVPECDMGPPGIRKIIANTTPDPFYIELCSSVAVNVSPKPVRKGI